MEKVTFQRPTPRRRALLVGLALLLLAPLAACGSDASDGASDADAGGESAEASGGEETTEPAADAYPVTIEHRYGETEITEAPERIVAVGLTDQDALIALGAPPVATVDWFGDYDGNIWPWAQDELEALGVDPADITRIPADDGIAAEQIAAQQPDLIVALYSGLTQEQYDGLSKIAPTVAQPEAHIDYGIPWQEQTVTIGKILGKADEAQAMVDDVEALFADAKADHPEFDGATATVATPYEGIFVYAGQDLRGRFITDLGMVTPESLLTELPDEFGGQLSPEKADLLDLDVIVWLDPDDAEGELGGPIYQKLAVHTEGREVLLGGEDGEPLGGAMSFQTVLSLPFLLDGVVPMFAAALDGDPATKVPAA